MKRVREFRTQGDFFYCVVTFLPDDHDFDDQIEEIIDVPGVPGVDPIFGCQLRMSFLIRYPKKVTNKTISSRFACISHPNLSPVIVAEEAARFLGIIKQMLEL